MPRASVRASASAPYNNVCEKRILFAPQDFDAAERDYLGSLIGERFTFLSISARISAAMLSLWLRRRGGMRASSPSSRSPMCFDRLIFNIGINPFGTVKGHGAGCGGSRWRAHLFLDPANQGEASVKIVNQDRAGRVRVPARALLGLVQDEGSTISMR